MYKSSRKIIVRVCEVASAKKVKPFKMFNLYSTMNRRGAAEDKDQPKELETTGHDRFCQIRPSRYAFSPYACLCVCTLIILSLCVCVPYPNMTTWDKLIEITLKFANLGLHFVKSVSEMCEELNLPPNLIHEHYQLPINELCSSKLSHHFCVDFSNNYPNKFSQFNLKKWKKIPKKNTHTKLANIFNSNDLTKISKNRRNKN